MKLPHMFNRPPLPILSDMTPAQFRDDHETTFEGRPEPVCDPADVAGLPVDRLRARMASGASGAVAARNELCRRTTALLRRDLGARG